MPDNSSQDNRLAKLTNSQLIEVINKLQEYERKLIAERDALKKQLNVMPAQTVEDASRQEDEASISEIVEQTQLIASKYLESVRDMNEKARQANITVVDAAEKQASMIVKDAILQAQHILAAANAKADQVAGNSFSSMLPHESEELMPIEPSFFAERQLLVQSAQPQERLVEPSDLDMFPYGDWPLLDMEEEGSESKLGIKDDILSFEEDSENDAPRIRPEDILAPTVTITIGEEALWDDDEDEEIAASKDENDANADHEERLEAHVEDYGASSDGSVELYDASMFVPKWAIRSKSSAIEDESETDDGNETLHEEAFREDPVSHEVPKADIGNESKLEIDAPREEVTEVEISSQVGKAAPESNASIDGFEPLDPGISGILSMTKSERKAAKKAAKMAKKMKKAAQISGNPRLEKMKREEGRKSGDEEAPVSAAAEDQSETSEEQMFTHAKQALKSATVPEIVKNSYDSFINANQSLDIGDSEFDYDSCFDDRDVYKD